MNRLKLDHSEALAGLREKQGDLEAVHQEVHETRCHSYDDTRTGPVPFTFCAQKSAVKRDLEIREQSAAELAQVRF